MKNIYNALGSTRPVIEEFTNEEFRDLTTIDHPGLVGPEKVSYTFIDSFPQKSVITTLGGHYFSGVEMSGQFPRLVKAEIPNVDLNVPEVGISADLSTVTFKYSDTSPERRGAFVEVSKLLNIQNPGMLKFINEQITKKIVSQVEKDFFTALLADAGINNAGIGLTHDLLNTMESSVSIENQLTDGLGYIANPLDMGKIKKIQAAGGDLLYRNGKLNDLPLLMSSVVPAGTLVFGKFSSAVITQFDQVNVILNIYTKSPLGVNQLVFHGFFDFDYLSATNFSKLSI